MTSIRWGRAIIGGIAGLFVGAAVGFPLLYAVGPATVFNEELQSPKLTAVWEELEPLPLMTSEPLAFALVLAFLGAAHSVAFGLVVRGLPPDRLRRGVTFGLVVWLLSTVYFELMAPFALLGEPLPLVGVEVAVGFVAAMAEGTVISFVYGSKSAQVRATIQMQGA